MCNRYLLIRLLILKTQFIEKLDKAGGNMV